MRGAPPDPGVVDVTAGQHEQLSLLLLEAARLADQLPGRSRGRTGPERLLVALVRGGLDREALPAAAALALELERAAKREAA